MHRRIFVGIDSSPTARKPLEEALSLTNALGASLRIASAIDEGPLDQHGRG